jgi:outer membrane protein
VSGKTWNCWLVISSLSLYLGLPAGTWAGSARLGDPLGVESRTLPPDLGMAVSDWEQFCADLPAWPPATRLQFGQLALCRNNRLKITLASLQAQVARHGQSISAGLPTASLTSSANARNTASFPINNRPELLVQGDRDRLRKTALSVSVPIPISGAVAAGIQSAHELVRAASWEVQEQIDTLLSDTLKASFELYLAQAMIGIYQSGQELAQDSAKIARGRETGGMASLSEVLQAEAASAKSKIDLLRAHESLQLKQAALASLLALAPEQVSNWRVEAADIGLRVRPDWDKASAVDQLAQRRPAMEAVLAKLRSADHRRSQVRRDGWFTASVTVGLAQQNQSNRGLTTQSGLEKSVGFAVNVPIFEGFARHYKVDEADAQLEGLRQESEELRLRLESEVAQNRALLIQEVALKTHAELYLSLSQGSHQAAQQRYRKGLAEVSEVINAQRELINARSEHLQSSVRLSIAQLRVHRDEGRLLEEFRP